MFHWGCPECSVYVVAQMPVIVPSFVGFEVVMPGDYALLLSFIFIFTGNSLNSQR